MRNSRTRRIDQYRAMVANPIRRDNSSSAPPPQGFVLLLGMARSGTSWLGKIFDSHPAVIYRHEPDSVLREPKLQSMCPLDEIPQYIGLARDYVFTLTTVHQIKSSGTRPVFPKTFQPPGARLLRGALALGLRAGESILPRAAWPKRIPIPDCIRGAGDGITYVIKSIALLDVAALLASALPECRIIALVRHPCGQVGSFRRGLTAGYMQSEQSMAGIWASSLAQELNFTRERYAALPSFERAVWAWTFLHATLFKEAEDFPNVRLVRYEDLCRSPLAEARSLMAFAGLPWAEQTARFIDKSTRGNGRERYYSVTRDPMAAAMKWRHELSPDEIARVRDIVERVLPGHFSYD